MTIFDAAALFLVMALLAALPSSSVLLVVSRSIAINRQNGLATAVGVVSGDLIFVALAVFGMAALSEQMGALFALIKYAAAGYLIWFGISLIRNRRQMSASWSLTRSSAKPSDLVRSFGAGLLLTLGDVKAIVFYASLLPAFLDMSALSTTDIGWIVAITIAAVGGVKAFYAIVAHRIAHTAIGGRHLSKLAIGSGTAMVAAGAYLVVKP